MELEAANGKKMIPLQFYPEEVRLVRDRDISVAVTRRVLDIQEKVLHKLARLYETDPVHAFPVKCNRNRDRPGLPH